MSERNLPILRADATASLCGICPDPGHCCKNFALRFSFWKDEGLEAAQQYLASWGSPFKIVDWQSDTYVHNDREYAEVVCSCPKVTSEGRCSIYEFRPTTCRQYVPGSDQLCVFQVNGGIRPWR